MVKLWELVTVEVVGNSGIWNVVVLMATGSARPVASRTGVLVTGRGLLAAAGRAWLLLSSNTQEYRVASTTSTSVFCGIRVYEVECVVTCAPGVCEIECMANRTSGGAAPNAAGIRVYEVECGATCTSGGAAPR